MLKSLHENILPLIIADGAVNQEFIHLLLQPQNAAGTAWKSTPNSKSEKQQP